MKPKHTLVFAAAALSISAPQAKAQIPVTDVAHMAQNQVNDIMAYIQYAKEVANGYQQIAHQVTQIQNQATELKRMGDLESLLQLAGLDGILDQLNATKNEFETMEDYFKDMTGEKALKYTGLGNISGIGSIFSVGEEQIERNPERYREAESVYSTIEKYRQVESSAAERRGMLAEEIGQTMTRLKGAKDEAEMAKYSGVLQGQKAAMDALNGEVDMAKSQVDVTAAEVAVSQEARKEAEAEKEAALMDRANRKDVKTYKIDNKPASFKGFPGVE